MDGPKPILETHLLNSRSFDVIKRSEVELRAYDDISEESDCISDTPETDSEDKNLTQDNGILAGLYHKLSTVHWRNVFTLLVIVVDSFLVSGSTSLIGTFFPTKALDKGTSSVEIGIIIGISPLTWMMVSPIIGYLLPKLGLKFPLSIGLATIGAAYVAMGPTIYLPSGWNFVVVCSVLRFIEGIGVALYVTTVYAVAAKLYPESVGLIIGILQFGSGLGFACASVIGGYLYMAGGYIVPFLVMGGQCLFWTIPTFFLLKNTKGSSQLVNIRMVAKLLCDFVFILLLLSVSLQVGALGFMIGTLAIFLKSEFSLTPGRIGLAFFSGTLFYILSAPILGKVADKTSPRCIIIIGLLLSGTAFLFIGPASFLGLQPKLWLLLLCLCVFGIAFGSVIVPAFPDMNNTAMIFLQLSGTPEEINSLSGIISGIIGGSVSFGEFFGPVIGGALTKYMNFQDSATVYGELLFALMIILLGVSLIDKFCKDYFSERRQKDVTQRLNNMCKSAGFKNCISKSFRRRQ